MSTKDKKGGSKTKSKSGIAKVSEKSEKKPVTKGKSLPEKHHKGTGGAKLKVVSPVPAPKKGVDTARKNRLKRAGFEIDICPVTGLPLDTGPRANLWLQPIEFHGRFISWLARVILESEITPDQLKKVAELLKKH